MNPSKSVRQPKLGEVAVQYIDKQGNLVNEIQKSERRILRRSKADRAKRAKRK
jgi:hypothetical protein